MSPDPFKFPIGNLTPRAPLPVEKEQDAMLEPVKKLKKDIAFQASSLGRQEARWANQTYYTIQRYRVASNNRLKALERGGSNEPHAFQKFAEAQLVWPWLDQVTGVGPTLGAGLVAHLELRPTVGAWWRFAGLDPPVTWEKGQKRPWNAPLKTLCWKISDSFVKVSGRDNAYYGKAYRERKQYEVERNTPENMAEVAAATLKAKNYGKDTVAKRAYEQGILPDSRVDMRARRWTVKLFLSHLHEVWWRLEHNEPPPKPWVIEHGGHAHYLRPPHTEHLWTS